MKKGISWQVINKPQALAKIIKVKIIAPKKPNSAQRKVAKVNLQTLKKPSLKTQIVTYKPKKLETISRIIGPGFMSEHSIVLLKGRGPKDLPGVQTCVIRGSIGIAPNFYRNSKRSKYGLKI